MKEKTEEEKKKRQEIIDSTVKIGIEIMHKFKAKPNPNKK